MRGVEAEAHCACSATLSPEPEVYPATAEMARIREGAGLAVVCMSTSLPVTSKVDMFQLTVGLNLASFSFSSVALRPQRS